MSADKGLDRLDREILRLLSADASLSLADIAGKVGLTPTPICVISSDSLGAVLHAPPGPWLYFTLVNQNGQMAFSTTFAQQLANERLAASRGIK